MIFVVITFSAWTPQRNNYTTRSLLHWNQNLMKIKVFHCENFPNSRHCKMNFLKWYILKYVPRNQSQTLAYLGLICVATLCVLVRICMRTARGNPVTGAKNHNESSSTGCTNPTFLADDQQTTESSSTTENPTQPDLIIFVIVEWCACFHKFFKKKLWLYLAWLLNCIYKLLINRHTYDSSTYVGVGGGTGGAGPPRPKL